MVHGWVLLLCRLYLPYIVFQHSNDCARDEISEFSRRNGSPPKLMLWQTMSRLREISLFECDVRVLRNGFCEFIQCIFLLIDVNWSYLQGGPFPPKSWFLVMCMNFPTHPLTRSRVTAYCCQGTALWMKACLLVRTKPKTLIFLYTSNSNRWIRPRV